MQHGDEVGQQVGQQLVGQKCMVRCYYRTESHDLRKMTIRKRVGRYVEKRKGYFTDFLIVCDNGISVKKEYINLPLLTQRPQLDEIGAVPQQHITLFEVAAVTGYLYDSASRMGV